MSWPTILYRYADNLHSIMRIDGVFHRLAEKEAGKVILVLYKEVLGKCLKKYY
jgi:hypothetical protein